MDDTDTLLLWRHTFAYFCEVGLNVVKFLSWTYTKITTIVHLHHIHEFIQLVEIIDYFTNIFRSDSYYYFIHCFIQSFLS